MAPKKTPMTDVAIKELIAQGVADALASYEANIGSGNGHNGHHTGSDSGRTPNTARVYTYKDFLNCQHLNFKVECQVKFATCTLLGSTLTWWNSHVKIVGHDAAYRMPWRTLMKKMSDKMILEESDQVEKYIGGLPENIRGHYKKDFLKLKNKNHGNQSGNGEAHARAYTLGGNKANPDSNVVTDTFLLNNRYASILFDTDTDRSFVLTAFSLLIDIIPTTLNNYYDVELANEKIIGVNTIIRGCTLNFLNHLFIIDLMPIELGSFDVIIGMEWLSKYHVVIVRDEKIVCVPFGNETLIILVTEATMGTSLD
ncbi:reverse transcriptase domain-containing protein [Tanacetum coccineum]